ncbi:hypothetical protein A2U01_0011539 [Trifolium medium]|uniref:Uncharacterized protein n=1 Tax=Trifolium medium TaxID=97028 RepID=A0A392MT22_9FABA|nr:hypothetical protein [Trifolium medium]
MAKKPRRKAIKHTLTHGCRQWHMSKYMTNVVNTCDETVFRPGNFGTALIGKFHTMEMVKKENVLDKFLSDSRLQQGWETRWKSKNYYYILNGEIFKEDRIRL